MNVLTISGNLGRDCRLNHTQSGTAVAGFAVAAKAGFGDNEQTIWVDCSLFGKRAESIAPHLVKGQQVVVSGEMGTREHEGKTYVTLRANDVTLVGCRPAQQQAPAPQQYQQPQQPAQQPQPLTQPPAQGFGQPQQSPAMDDYLDQDIPF